MAVQARAFPEIEGPDFVRSSEVEKVAEKVLGLHGGIGGVVRLFPIAEAIRDGELKILWLLNTKPFNDQSEDDQEPEIAGRCVKAPGLWRDFTGYDFAIWARKHFWDQFDPELRRALVLHELLHIEVKRDNDGNPKFATRKHDVEDFVDVARQYGPGALAGDGARYVRAAALFAGEPEPAIGRHRHRKSAGEVLDEVITTAAEKILDAVEAASDDEDLRPTGEVNADELAGAATRDVQEAERSTDGADDPPGWNSSALCDECALPKGHEGDHDPDALPF